MEGDPVIDTFSCALCPNRSDLKAKCCCAESEADIFKVTDARLLRRANLRPGDGLCAFHYDRLNKGMIFGQQTRCCAPFHVDGTPGKRLRPVLKSWRSLFNNELSPRYMPALQICDACYQITLDILPNGTSKQAAEENVGDFLEPDSPNDSYQSPRRWMSNQSLHNVDTSSETSSSAWSFSPRPAPNKLMSLYAKRHGKERPRYPYMNESIRRLLHSKSIDLPRENASGVAAGSDFDDARSVGSSTDLSATPRAPPKLIKRVSSKTLQLKPSEKDAVEDGGRICRRLQNNDDVRVSQATVNLAVQQEAVDSRDRLASKINNESENRSLIEASGNTAAGVVVTQQGSTVSNSNRVDAFSRDLAESIVDQATRYNAAEQIKVPSIALEEFSVSLVEDILDYAVSQSSRKGCDHVTGTGLEKYASSLTGLILHDPTNGALSNVCRCCAGIIFKRCCRVVQFAQQEAERIMSGALAAVKLGDAARGHYKAVSGEIVKNAVESALQTLREERQQAKDNGNTKVEWLEDKGCYRTIFSIPVNEDESGTASKASEPGSRKSSADRANLKERSASFEELTYLVDDLVPIRRSLSSGFIDQSDGSSSSGVGGSLDVRQYSMSSDSIFVIHVEPVDDQQTLGEGEILVNNIRSLSPPCDEVFKPKSFDARKGPDSAIDLSPKEPAAKVVRCDSETESLDSEENDLSSIVEFYPSSSEDDTSSLDLSHVEEVTIEDDVHEEQEAEARPENRFAAVQGKNLVSAGGSEDRETENRVEEEQENVETAHVVDPADSGFQKSEDSTAGSRWEDGKQEEEDERKYGMDGFSSSYYAPPPTSADLVREYMPAARRRVTQFLRAASDAEMLRARRQTVGPALKSTSNSAEKTENTADAEPEDVADVMCQTMQDITPVLLRRVPANQVENTGRSKKSLVLKAVAIFGFFGAIFYAGWRYYYPQ